MTNSKTPYRHFSLHELTCKHCGKSNLNPEFHRLMLQIDKLRHKFAKPMIVTSAYRCSDHPIEARKAKSGQHSLAAIDIRTPNPTYAYDLVKLAMGMGFTGIGIARNFVHFDMRPTPTIWTYTPPKSSPNTVTNSINVSKELLRLMSQFIVTWNRDIQFTYPIHKDTIRILTNGREAYDMFQLALAIGIPSIQLRQHGNWNDRCIVFGDGGKCVTNI